MPTSSPFGFRYVLCFCDLATKYLEVYYLRNAPGCEIWCVAPGGERVGPRKAPGGERWRAAPGGE
eukprot:5256226-Pleurochrysis_carterae.AAC.1